MILISSRDETFLKLNSVMTLRHSRKRDKIYLKKLFYLRNFLNLLQVYRAYLSWKFHKRLKHAVDWHHRREITWWGRQRTVDWNPILYLPDIESIVIFRFYQCQLSISHYIKSPRLLFFDMEAADKTLQIFSERETLHKNLLIVCEGDDNEFVDCENLSWLTSISSNFLLSRSNVDELVRSINAIYCQLNDHSVERE